MKQIIVNALCATGVLPRLVRARGQSFILMFHEVGVGAMSATAFRQLLLSLRPIFRFAAMDELLHPAPAGSPPQVFLTFDDGLRNQAEVAYPILQELEVPATFYVCPDLIETRSWVWTYEIRQRVDSMTHDVRLELAQMLYCPSPDTDSIMARIRSLPLKARQDAHQQVRIATSKFQPTVAQSRKFDLMDWAELGQLDRRLITIGSHTMGHAMLNTLTPEQAKYEIVESRRVLEKKLDREVSHFCYPNGLLGPIAEHLVRDTYRTATTTAGYWLPTDKVDLHRLPRLGAESATGQMLWKLYRTTQAGRLFKVQLTSIERESTRAVSLERDC
jgi:peptidoglycan/xylan/chitin deacetylase (PgdA/CDA1 family)